MLVTTLVVRHFDVRDRVHRTGHRAGHERGKDHAHVAERTAVLEGVQLIVRDLAVAGAADCDVLQLGATVAERQPCSRCGSRASTSGRPSRLGSLAEQQLLWVCADLGAESTADVGSDDAHVRRVEPVGADDLVLHALGVLGADPLVQPSIDPGNGGAADF